MKKAYNAVFYELLRFVFWVHARDTQEWSALFYFAFLQFLNLFALDSAIEYQLYPYGHRTSIPGVVGFAALLVFGNYHLLRRNPVFRNPANIHQLKHRASTAWLVGAYVVLSVIVGFYFIKQMHDVNVLYRH